MESGKNFNFNKSSKNSNNRNNFTNKFIMLMFASVLTVAGGFAGGFFYNYIFETDKVVSETGNKSVVMLSEGNSVIEQVVEEALPAVVGVLSPLYERPFKNKFSKKFPFPFPFSNKHNNVFFNEELSDVQFEQPGVSGSGFFVNYKNKKYIITNFHVVESFVDAIEIGQVSKHDSIRIMLDNKHNVEDLKKASIVGYDKLNDVAVLKLDNYDVSKVKCLNIADNSTIKAGATVIAIGYPITFENYTVTRGIISAVRKIVLDNKSGTEVPVIQTDAAINSGNSGGPLLNSSGEVVGINVAKTIGTTVDAIAFALNMQYIWPIIEQILETGSKNRGIDIPSLGLKYELDKQSVLSHICGVVVTGFTPNSPARDAGVMQFDLIRKINDAVVNNATQLQKELAKYKPGDEVELTLYRQNQFEPIIIKVKLCRSQDTDPATQIDNERGKDRDRDDFDKRKKPDGDGSFWEEWWGRF